MNLLVIERKPETQDWLQNAFVDVSNVTLRFAECWMAAIPLVRDCWPDFVVVDWANEDIDDELKLRGLEQLSRRGIRYVIWTEAVDTLPECVRQKAVGKTAGMDVLKASIELRGAPADNWNSKATA